MWGCFCFIGGIYFQVWFRLRLCAMRHTRLLYGPQAQVVSRRPIATIAICGVGLARGRPLLRLYR